MTFAQGTSPDSPLQSKVKGGYRPCIFILNHPINQQANPFAQYGIAHSRHNVLTCGERREIRIPAVAADTSEEAGGHV